MQIKINKIFDMKCLFNGVFLKLGNKVTNEQCY